MSDYTYEGMRRVTYAGGATFVPVCETCRRIVKADSHIMVSGNGLSSGANAMCKACGRTRMLFEGFIGEG